MNILLILVGIPCLALIAYALYSAISQVFWGINPFAYREQEEKTYL